MLARPTIGTMARSRSESIAPEFWPALAIMPCLGNYGASARDYSGGNRTGTFNGGMTVAADLDSGPYGMALDFDASDDYLSCASINIGTRYTIFGIIYPRAHNLILLADRGATVGPQFNFGIQTSGGTNQARLFVQSTSATATTASACTLNQWNVLSVAYSAQSATFLTGLPNSLNAPQTIALAANPASAGNTVSIGMQLVSGTTPATPSNGQIALVYLIPQALDVTQLRRLASDPFLPFRRRVVPRVSSFAPTFIPQAILV